MMNKNAKIYIAGHRGLVGSAIQRKLESLGFTNIITRVHRELDLISQSAVERFFAEELPEYVFLAAAKVGGIGANSAYPAEFIYQNMMIGFNVIHAAYKHKVKKLLNLGSSCIYPRNAPQPLREEYLLSDYLEKTNEAYAVAKIAVIKLCACYNSQYGTNFISVMPANLYGPQDTYNIENGHVLPSMIKKFHDAKMAGDDSVTLWGDGTPLREFLYSDDLAGAVVFLMEQKNAADIGEFINIGSGKDLSILELADLVRDIVYTGAPEKKCGIVWDASRPNGTMRKVLDVSKMSAFGWQAPTSLADGIKTAYSAFLRELHKG